MTFLIDRLGGIVVPEGITNPGFKYTTPLGPPLAEDAFMRCSSVKGAQLRIVDRNDGTILAPSELEELRPDGDLTYIAYSEEGEWICLYGNDLEIGILFSEIDPSGLLDNLNVSLAKERFFSSMEVRKQAQSDYYDVETLNAWTALAQV